MKLVVLLTIDTLRKDAVGCYGGNASYTPFLNSIQDRCIRFSRPVSVGPYTQAGFPGILSSSYYLDYGYPKEKKLNPNRVLISEPLQREGVLTAAFHSNAYLCAYFGWNRGWSFFYDSMEEEVTDKRPYIEAPLLNAKVNAWLAEQSGNDKKMFLWVHYMDVHEPYIPDRRYLDDVDASISLGEEEMLTLFKSVLLKRDVSDAQKIRTLKSLYLAGIRKVDDHIKELFAVLKDANVLDSSVIIITSDHGDEFGEHGGLSHDGKMYSELVDVPLLIFDPHLKKGGVCEKVVSTLDIPPTVMHLFGSELSPRFQGRSLLPAERYPEKGVFCEALSKCGHRETGNEKPVYMYREDDLKIIYRQGEDRWEMYDLKRDPAEREDIIAESPQAEDLKEKLRPRVRRWGKR